jgi:hypothetical protein
MREEVVLAALHGLAEERGGARYRVALYASDDERRRRTLAKRFSTNDDRIVTSDEEKVVVATRSLADVRFLVGFHVWRALVPTARVLVRTPDVVAAVDLDWDAERFYVAEVGDALLRHVRSSAAKLGLEVIDDDGEIPTVAGTRESLAALRAWMRGGAVGLPDGF